MFNAKLKFDAATADVFGNVSYDSDGIDISKRGFTNHEHLDEMQLIHMNGRMYDYNNGRFLSVDPFIQSPTSSQSMNPYTYIFNNPLSGSDPTGYVSESDKIVKDSVNITTRKTAPIGSNIRSNVTTTATAKTASGEIISASSTNGGAAVINGVDSSGVKGAVTKLGGSSDNKDTSNAGNQNSIATGGVDNDDNSVNDNNTEQARSKKEEGVFRDKELVDAGIRKLRKNVNKGRGRAIRALKKYCKANASNCVGFTVDDLKNLEVVAVDGFRDKEDDSSSSFAKGALDRSDKVPVIKLFLGAIFIATGGDTSIEVIAETIIHEFYHASPDGTTEFNTFNSNLKQAKIDEAFNKANPNATQRKVWKDPGYINRIHEKNARKFTREVFD